MLNAPNKDKDSAIDIQKKLDSELKETNKKLLVEFEKVRMFQENLDKAKFELEELKVDKVFPNNI